jgi:spore maturation protein SpmB
MQQIANLILESGKSAVELALYILLPVMVVMTALMKLLEAKGALARVAAVCAPVLRLVKIPGLGAFAILQMLLVSFAAPVATLRVMDAGRTSKREIGATLAMLFTLSQANTVFPLAVVGLDLRFVTLFAVLGGGVASILAYYLLKDTGEEPIEASPGPVSEDANDQSSTVLSLLSAGGWDGVQLVLKSIPILVLALLLVNALSALKVIALVETLLSPVLVWMDLPGIAVLAIATKYLAGGTAFTGVAIDLVQHGAMSSQDLNRIAGLVINPLDLVGVSVLVSAGPRVAAVLQPALIGAAAGVLVRTVLHLIVF